MTDLAPATACPTCGAHFSRDGRFCPFDRSPLLPAAGWDPRVAALLGSVIDNRYEVLSVLGEGGMGVVYEVRHTLLGKRFALKALREDLARDRGLSARFIQEARTAAALSHPGLVEITDFGQLESGQVYFVMELLDGCSLAALLRRGGPLPAARALELVRQLGRALDAAHAAGVVHRDLKPDNIHVGRGYAGSDRVTVLDFGLAKLIGSDRVTRAGMVFGTPHYMSPEQAAGEAVDHRADIYALGVVMYEMFTGKVPFEADSYQGVLTKHLYAVPAPPSALRPELAALGALEQVILRALQKRPANRYESLALLLDDLEQRLPGWGPPSRPSSSPPLADQLELPTAEELAPSPAPDPWRLAAAALSAIALGALGFALVSWGSARSERLEFSSASASATRRPVAVVAHPPSRAEPVAEPPRPAFVTNSLPPPTLPSGSAHKPAAAPPPARVASAPAKARAPAARPRLETADIVDPWAR